MLCSFYLCCKSLSRKRGLLRIYSKRIPMYMTLKVFFFLFKIYSKPDKDLLSLDLLGGGGSSSASTPTGGVGGVNYSLPSPMSPLMTTGIDWSQSSKPITNSAGRNSLSLSQCSPLCCGVFYVYGRFSTPTFYQFLE